MAQNNRPLKTDAERRPVPKVDDLVARMRELRRLREQVVAAESGDFRKLGSTVRPAPPSRSK